MIMALYIILMKCQLELALTLVYKAIGVYSKLQILCKEK